VDHSGQNQFENDGESAGGGEIPFPQKTLLPVLSPFRIVNAIMISLVCPSSWDISSFLTPICGLFTAPYLQAVEPHRWILLF
jgi:hypothetical protein